MSKQESKHKSRRFRRFLKATEGVSALEYAILVGVIAVAIGAALVTFSDNIKTAMTNIGTGIAATTSPGTPLAGEGEG